METASQMKWNGLQITTDSEVYEPQEDSFLLAKAARKFASGSVLDLGCGTGIVGITAAKNTKTGKVTFADISEKAVSLAAHNVHQNKVGKPVEFVTSDLFSKIRGKFDTLCFNPPYLPTEREEKLEGKLNKAFDGGKDGRKILDRFLREFETRLKPGGVLLLLNSSVSAKDGLSGNRITREKLEKKGFTVEQVASERFFFEELVVLKALKAKSTY